MDDLTNINMLLGLLSADGDSTLTYAPQSGSPAIDKGNPAASGSGGNACEATDRRAFAHPMDGDGNGSARYDIGA